MSLEIMVIENVQCPICVHQMERMTYEDGSIAEDCPNCGHSGRSVRIVNLKKPEMREMEAISDEILQQVAVVFNVIGSAANDFSEMHGYALQNKLFRLAGWLSWNGHFFEELLEVYRSKEAVICRKQAKKSPHIHQWEKVDFHLEDDEQVFIEQYLRRNR